MQANMSIETLDNDVIRGKALESLFVTYRRYTTHF